MKRKIAVLACLLLITVSANAKYSGGTGDANDPYLISTPEDMNAIGSDPCDFDKHFILTTDINMADYIYTTALIAPDTSSSSGFQGTVFTGIFDGDDYKITSLTIDTAGAGNDYLGLFGYIDSGGDVNNLGLEDVNMTGGYSSDYIGGLVGYNWDSTISNCYATGQVTGGDDSEDIGGLVGVNVVVGMIFIFGVIKFAKITPNPWLALVSVTPYLIIVIGMSATRQSAAIGLVFLVLANLNQSNIKKIGLSLLAISFHYSAVIVLFFVLHSMKMTTWLRWSILIVGGLVSFAILKDTSKALEYNQTYAVANIVSPGAIQHAMLNGIPAIIYLLFIKKWNRVYGQVELMKILAIASLLSVAMVFVSSTAVDRLALYLSPIQMLVYATLPVVFRNSIYSVAIIVMHFMILYIWMAYANTAIVFFPYRNLIFL